LDFGFFENVKVNVNEGLVAGGWWRVTRNYRWLPRRREGVERGVDYD
jgi:hypothetical protein